MKECCILVTIYNLWFMKSLREEISKLQSISLEEMDGVKLMSRNDKKYWISGEHLTEIIAEVAQDYFMLEVGSERLLPYTTIYYDTPLDDMYSNHHRGKKNRYKIRRRNYCATQSSFLEVKFKNNKGRTIKSRHTSDYNAKSFSLRDKEFIAKYTPYSSDELKRVLENRFYRITLVSKRMNERCTIDLDIHFKQGEQEVALSNLVVIEVKTDGRSHSVIADALLKLRLRESGFSKYCIGRSLIDDSIKHNSFKLKHRQIEKITNNSKEIWR